MLVNRKGFFLLSLALAVLCSTTGCGSAGPARGSASGTVTLNGQPVDGSITFVPTNGTAGPTAGAAIQGGKYTIPKADGPLVGNNRVELRAWRLTGRQIPNPMSEGQFMDEKVEAFSPEYNDATKLVREVKSGHNSLDFALESAAATP
jgi:hypothetical protein